MRTKKIKGGLSNPFSSKDINVQIYIQELKIIPRTIKINKTASFEELIGKINEDGKKAHMIIYNGKKIYITYDGFTITNITDDKSEISINFKYYDGKPIMVYKSDIAEKVVARKLAEINQYKVDSISKITYTFHRHGFSCNNLNKEFGTAYQLNDIDDPSLSLYGMFDILLNENSCRTYTQEYNGYIFVSSLIRTWQTATLLHFSEPNVNKFIVVSPYIKEEHGMAKGNMPLIFEDQLRRMKFFFSLLKAIYRITSASYVNSNGFDSNGIRNKTKQEIICRKIKQIYNSSITILDPTRKKQYTISKSMYNEPLRVDDNYVKSILENVLGTPLYNKSAESSTIDSPDLHAFDQSQQEYINTLVKPPSLLLTAIESSVPEQFTPVEQSPFPGSGSYGQVLMPDSVPVKSYTAHDLITYYEGNSFMLFDKWISSYIPDIKRAFVVCHSHTMQSILKKHTPSLQKENPIFKSNVWSFTYNSVTNKFIVTMGLKKPAFTKKMSFNLEPVCKLPDMSTLPQKDLVPNPEQYQLTYVTPRLLTVDQSNYVGGKTRKNKFKRKK
jgi:hypothetical protein